MSGTDQNPAGPIISIRGMSKFFGPFQALADIDLDVDIGERIVICGPSGSGKSTLIRCINRLEAHQSGSIHVDGVELHQHMKDIDVVRSQVGMVFQHFNLFPHMTVLENCTAGPKWVSKIPAKEAHETAMRYLTRVSSRTGQQISYPVIRRTTTTRGDRPGLVHEPQGHVVRLTDIGTRS